MKTYWSIPFVRQRVLVSTLALSLVYVGSTMAATVSFWNPTSNSEGTAPAAVAAADFNRPGITDLAVANSASGNVNVLLGNDDGTLQASKRSPFPTLRRTRERRERSAGLIFGAGAGTTSSRGSSILTAVPEYRSH